MFCEAAAEKRSQEAIFGENPEFRIQNARIQEELGNGRRKR